MTSFILIAICIIGGMLFRRFGRLPPDAHKGINTWIIYLALPAVSLKYLPHIAWSNELLLPAISPLVIWLGAWIYIRRYAAASGLSKSAEGGLKLNAGLSNTSFLGFPLIVAYFSEKELGIAIICDQATFLLLSTAAVIVAMNSSQHHTLKFSLLLRRLLLFPPFIGFALALLLPRLIDISPLEPLFDKLASTVGPLALFSIGLQLKFNGWREYVKPMSVALLYKLLLAPLLVLIIALLLGVRGKIAQIAVFEAAMPTLLSAGIIAEEYGLEARLVNLIVGVGIVLSLLTTFIWWCVITYLL